jgi:hypothetical protein
MGVLYECTKAQWYGYLREVLRPRTDDLVAAWRDPGGRRFGTAAALALLAPATDGVSDFLLRRALAEGDFRSFWFLGAMGPAAAAAIPDLERAIADPGTGTEVRAYAATSLNRIRDSADREGLRRTQLFPMQ